MFAEIITVEWNRVTVAYDSVSGSTGRISFEGPHGERLLPGEIEATAGRVEIDGLSPDTEYRLRLADRELICRTLPEPRGVQSGEFLLVADPHLSLEADYRNGRLRPESVGLLREMLQLAEHFDSDAVLLPGDLTDSGDAREYQACARILEGSAVPWFAVSGNHDCSCGTGCIRDLWREYIGETTVWHSFPFATLLGLDTSTGLLGAGADLLERALDIPGLLFVMTHYPLYETPWVREPAATVADAAEHRALLRKLAERPETVILAGHKNIPNTFSPGRAVQLTLPQTVQYPCGAVRCRIYEREIRLTFQPIASEILRQWSRRAGDAAAAAGQPAWGSAYRRGDGTFLNLSLPR